MTNTLVREVAVDDSIVVETVAQLRSALDALCDYLTEDLSETYVVERLKETLSDRSVAVTIRLRKAEAV